MILHPASRRELRRISLFSAAGTVLLIAVMGLVPDFDPRVVTGAMIGCAVAIGNFAFLCLTVQKAVSIDNPKVRQAFIQGSYHARLLLQAGWVAAAFAIPKINVFAASVPLLFPGLILFLNRKMHKKTQ